MKFRIPLGALLTASMGLLFVDQKAQADETEMWARKETKICEQPPNNDWKMGNRCRTVPAGTKYAIDFSRPVQSSEGLSYPLYGTNKSWGIAEDWVWSEEQVGDDGTGPSELGDAEPAPTDSANSASMAAAGAANPVGQNLIAALSWLKGKPPQGDLSELYVFIQQLDETPDDISAYPTIIGSQYARAILDTVNSSSFCIRVQVEAIDPVAYKMKLGVDFFTLIAGLQERIPKDRQADPPLYQEVIATYRLQKAMLACLNE